MSFSSGTFSLYVTGNPVVTGTTITSTWANNTLNDIATGLSTCVLKDGTQTTTSAVPFAAGITGTTVTMTGIIYAGDDFHFTSSNPNIYGGDTDGLLTITPDTSIEQGAVVKLYGNTHGTLANDITFLEDTTAWFTHDASASTLNITDSITCTGFTSTGIDDNASAEKLQIADALISLTSTDVNVPGDLQVGSTDGQQDAQTALQVVGSGGLVSTTLSSSADDFMISNDANTGITIVSGLNANGLIAFADAGDGDIGRIDYDHNDNSMSLYTNNTVGLKIDTSQNVDIPAGDLTISAGFQNLGTALEITIATGAVTATQSHHSIDTQSDASSDTLDTIGGGTEGDILFIRSVSNDRDIIVGHNTGNIILRGGANVTLATTNDSLMLIYNGTTWDEVLNYT